MAAEAEKEIIGAGVKMLRFPVEKARKKDLPINFERENALLIRALLIRALLIREGKKWVERFPNYLSGEKDIRKINIRETDINLKICEDS